jgi:hypothetical protein
MWKIRHANLDRPDARNPIFSLSLIAGIEIANRKYLVMPIQGEKFYNRRISHNNCRASFFGGGIW